MIEGLNNLLIPIYPPLSLCMYVLVNEVLKRLMEASVLAFISPEVGVFLKGHGPNGYQGQVGGTSSG